MSLEDVKRFAEIVVMGMAGAWGIAGIFVLKQRQKALAEMRKIDLETKKLTLDSRQSAVVDISINAVSHPVPVETETAFCIIADVTLHNLGSRDTRIKWTDEAAAFTVRRATFDVSGVASFPEKAIELRVRQARNPNVQPVSTVIRAKGVQRFAFAARVPSAGIYLLSFRGVVAPEEANVSLDAGVEKHNPTAWTCTKFIVVGNQSAATSPTPGDG